MQPNERKNGCGLRRKGRAGDVGCHPAKNEMFFVVGKYFFLTGSPLMGDSCPSGKGGCHSRGSNRNLQHESRKRSDRLRRGGQKNLAITLRPLSGPRPDARRGMGHIERLIQGATMSDSGQAQLSHLLVALQNHCEALKIPILPLFSILGA